MPHQAAPRVALVPFYLKLYDDCQPDRRNGFTGFVQRIAEQLELRGLTVQCTPICRVADEFANAVKECESEGVDCLVTLHLAYSPSLEAVESFCATSLPILILDVSMDADFGVTVSPDRIMYNHGVHGVMDFACMLRRRGRPFEIVAGHDSDPRVLDRAAERARAVVAAKTFGGSRVLRVGAAFEGMGDFSVPQDVLSERLGIHAEEVGIEVLDAMVASVTDAAVAEEVERDRQRFACELTDESHARSVRVGLGLRHLLDEGDYRACSVNFQSFDRADRPSDTMPFLEISKAMARGIGYAGEGDVLTAALGGALSRLFAVVSFTEVFCANWAGRSLFLSHMGEINPDLADDIPRVIEKPAFLPRARNPAILTCSARPGPAVFVNLAPGPEDTFSLIVVPVEILAETDALNPALRDTIRIWVKPQMDVSAFLERYSLAGGTHHSELVLGDHAETVSAFGRLAGLEVVELKA